MAVELTAIATGFALLAPVYGLLFNIQRNIGRLSSDHGTLEDRFDSLENEVVYGYEIKDT